MDVERWHKIEDVFGRALELSASERGAFVAAECGGDESLAAQVLGLLESADHAGASLRGIVAANFDHAGITRDLVAGHVIGDANAPDRYRIVALAGRGGFGTVYRASDVRTGREVALKVFGGRHADFPRFEREAAMLAALAHDNVVSYLGHGLTQEEAPYLVMEWLEGQDLATALQQQRFGVERALRVGLHAAQGLAAAHEKGIIHRDIKPSNLFLVGGRPDGVRVIDFGLARRADPTTKITSTGTLLGTPTYMAPEQAASTRALTPSVDVFALGCVLFECLAGSPAFEGPNALAVLAKIVSGDVPRLSTRRPETPPAVDTLISQMMAADPADRYADAAAAALAISDVLSSTARTPKPVVGAAVVSRQAAARTVVQVSRRSSPGHALLVGRARELSILDGAYAECSEEQRARLVLVLGEAGIGKTSLIRAALQRFASKPSPPLILGAQGDRPTSTSPFALLRQFVRERWASRNGKELRSELESLGMSSIDAVFLCELAGVELEDIAMRAARRDPLVMADVLRCAWLAFIETELRRGPLVLVLEDLHMADAASVRLLALAIDHAKDGALLVIASVRPDEGTPQLSMLEAHHPEMVEVRPLRPPLAAELARALTDSADVTRIEQIVADAAGNPLRLTELAALSNGQIADAAGAEAFEARLARLDRQTQHVLRAGSVFGLRFDVRGVLALLGAARTAADVEAAVRIASDARIVDARPDGSVAFAHAVFQEAAYRLVADSERELAHGAAAAWLARQAGVDPSVVAWHYERAQAREEAFAWYFAAARSALRGGVLPRAFELLEQALACEPTGRARADVLVLQAAIAFARGDTGDSRAAAQRALDDAPAGSLGWFTATGSLITAAGQRGDNDAVAAIAGTLESQPAEEDAVAERTICLCRAASQLFASGRRDRARILIDAAAAARSSDPSARAWVAHTSSMYSIIQHDYDQAVDLMDTAMRLHTVGGDLRAACLMRNFKASYYVFAADFPAADTELDIVEPLARRVGADYVARWSRYTRGKVLALAGDPRVAREQLAEVRRDLASSPRIVAGTHIYGALAALRARDAGWAAEEARAAQRAHDVKPIQAVALAALSRALVMLDQPREALESARAAEEIRTRLEHVEENESLVFLALPEALAAGGFEDEARPLAARALGRLQGIASKMASASGREAYLHTVEVHAETFRLAHRLGVAP